METYVSRNPVRRWISELRATRGQPLIFSPAVTSETAETVLAAAGARKARVYTSVDPILFALGRSSLTTIKHLLDAGHEVYSLPGFHAKIVLVQGEYASIGSQNLAAGVSQRLEATAMTTDPSEVERILREVTPWLDSATRLYPRTEKRVRTLVRPFAREQVRLGPDLDRLRDQVSVTIRECEAEEKLERRRLAQLGAAAREASRASPAKRLSLKEVSTGYNWDFGYARSVWTLMCRNGNLLRWSLRQTRRGSDSQILRLAKTYRYLTLVPNTGRLGWARIMKTRITQFGMGINWTEKIPLAGCRRQVAFEALDPRSHGANLRVKIDQSAVLLDCWFSLTGLELQDVTVPGQAPMLERLSSLLVSDWDSISSALLSRLLEPFKYEGNSLGVQAHVFLEATHGKWLLRVGTTESGSFLVLER